MLFINYNNLVSLNVLVWQHDFRPKGTTIGHMFTKLILRVVGIKCRSIMNTLVLVRSKPITSGVKDGEGKLCELQRPGKSKIQKTNFILTNLNCRLSIKYDSIKSFIRWNKKILSFLKKQHCS